LIDLSQNPATVGPAPTVIERASEAHWASPSERSATTVRVPPAESREQSGVPFALVADRAMITVRTADPDALPIPSPRVVGVPKVLPRDYEAILSEREQLLRRKYGAPILTRDEERRLEFLKWQIETVEDGQLADGLSRLELLLDRVDEVRQRVEEGVAKFKEPFPAAFRPRGSSGGRQ